jgi:hypothetical protein
MMKTQKIILWISICILPLAIFAACMGLFWQGEGESYPFDTLRGETVTIRGHGLYRYDTVNSSSQELGQDLVTLLVGIPLLVAGMVLSQRGSLRGQLLLAGSLGYFLYTYAAMSFLTAFNELFLVYVILFSLSLFGLILALSHLDPDEIKRRASDRFPRRSIITFFIIVALFLTFAWLNLVVPAMVNGTPPPGLESAITMVIQALDLAVIVPTSLITAILLSKRQPWGYALSSVVLLKILTMGAALMAMIISQVMAGVTVDPVISVLFFLISITGIILAVLTLRSIEEYSK